MFRDVRFVHRLQQKLKSFLDQYTAREEHFQHQLEAKELTIQLAEAKLHRQIELTSQESQKTKLTMMKAKEFSDREVQLQVQIYQICCVVKRSHSIIGLLM